MTSNGFRASFSCVCHGLNVTQLITITVSNLLIWTVRIDEQFNFKTALKYDITHYVSVEVAFDLNETVCERFAEK